MLLAWFQRDDAGARLWAARHIEAAGDLGSAMPQYRRSLALKTDVPVLTDLVRIHFTRGESRPSAAAATATGTRSSESTISSRAAA